jgi:hypothetical protein
VAAHDTAATAATSVGLGPTLVGGALLLTASLALAIPLSISFAHSLNLDPEPLKASYGPSWVLRHLPAIKRGILFAAFVF